MKKLLLVVATACLFVVPAKSQAQSVLIHYWNFNNFTQAYYYPNISAIKANYSAIDTNKAEIMYQPQNGWDPTSYDGITYIDSYLPSDTANESQNLRNGDSTGLTARVANPSDSMELLFYIPSTGYNNLKFKFISYPSSTGSGQSVQVYDYSVDSGVTWITTGLSELSDTFTSKIWRLDSFTFNNDAVNNNPALVFRVRFTAQNTSASGNNRFDNVTLDGDTVAVDTTGNNTSVANISNNTNCIIFPNPASSNITVMTAAGNKTIELYTVTGQKVFVAESANKETLVDISKLAAGLYYVHVRMGSGAIYTSNFIKK